MWRDRYTRKKRRALNARIRLAFANKLWDEGSRSRLKSVIESMLVSDNTIKQKLGKGLQKWYNKNPFIIDK